KLLGGGEAPEAEPAAPQRFVYPKKDLAYGRENFDFWTRRRDPPKPNAMGDKEAGDHTFNNPFESVADALDEVRELGDSPLLRLNRDRMRALGEDWRINH